MFSFVSRRIQPLQHRKYPAFRYEGTKDPTRFSPEPMARSEVVRMSCKLLDNFDESLILPSLFWASNPPEKSWVSISKYYRVLEWVVPSAFLMKPLSCRRITKHGTACLHLQMMPPNLVAIMKRSGRQLLDHCCRGKHISSIVASKNLTFSIRSKLISTVLYWVCFVQDSIHF